jgi:RimJ/RimL family protein N-acetyltransferase
MTLNHLGQPIGEAIEHWNVPPAPSKITLQGQYCRLEPLSPERHTQDLFEANAVDKEGRNFTYLFQEPFKTVEDYQQWISASCLDNDSLYYAILNTEQKAIGIASYLRITPSAGSIEVGGINFSPLLQKTPTSTEAMFLMMKHAFELGYRRYEWKCDALNQPSRNAAQRLGFSYEGTFRQAIIYKNRNRDTAWYAIIDKEWPKLEQAYLKWLNPSNFENGKQKVRLSDLTAPILVARG